jgi:hypothetical protein
MWIVQDFGILKHALKIHDISICLPAPCPLQDSNYWPLTDPTNPKPSSQLTLEDVAPQVTSLWLGVDRVREDNGAMEVLTFRAQPESCQTLPQEFIVDAGGSTDGYLEIL